MARRRAARESRQLPSSPNPGSPPSSSFPGLVRRPFSLLGAITTGKSDGKRQSNVIGLMDGINGMSADKGQWSDGDVSYMSYESTLLADLIWRVKLPLSTSHNSHPPDHVINTYERQSNFSPIPQMIISPTSPPRSSPFADPLPVNPPSAPRISHVSMDSSDSFLPAVHPSSEPNSLTYGYAGPSWRGGAGIQSSIARPEGGDKWWHALCAWGTDLDGDGDEQGGRTNPFE